VKVKSKKTSRPGSGKIKTRASLKKTPVSVTPSVHGHWVSKGELTQLRDKLKEAQETLDAIRSGEVDAVVVAGPRGSQIYSLSSVEQPYRVYVERMQEGAVTISADGLILYCNQRFAEMLKLPLQRVIGAPAAECLPESALAKISGVFGEDTEAVKYECELRCDDGSSLPVHLTASPLPLQDQTVICLVVTDLTGQRRQEELRTAKEVAERANLAKDSFLATLSHELRTPLTPALMSIMALEHEDALPQSVRSELAMIRRNIELETRLIDDLLDLTRIANGKLELHIAPIDLHAVLNRAVEICQANVDAKQQRLSVRLNARHAETMGDPVRLQQVLWNLLRNAVKFTPSGGAITVTTKNISDQRLQFEVQDTGMGFEPAAEQRLFQAFEQSGRGITQQFGGLGLGLAISRSIVEAHGGSIRGQSSGTGKGATFTVTLPLRAVTSRVPGSEALLASALPSQGREILIVEDHPDTRATLQRLLERAGHRVTAAKSGRHALEIAATARFDLVISDLGLPDMPGNALMTLLRERYQLPGIAVSGYGMEGDVSGSRQAGFVHHLTKPICIDRLKELIAAVVAGDRPPDPANTPSRFGEASRVRPVERRQRTAM
jgi:PAS domain S-box-containing protein